MEWQSEELKKYYQVLNKYYVISLKKKYPYVKFVLIDPESFQSEVMNGKWTADVYIYICADWELKDEKYSHIENSLGNDSVTMLINLQKMIEKPDVLTKTIYPKLELNKKEYCENLLRYTH